MTRVNSLPKDVQLSPHLRERARFYLQVTLFGRPMYIAVTDDVLRALSIDAKGQPKTYRKRYDFEIQRGILDIINSLELQVRDNVMAGIQENVTNTLLDRMRDLMRPTIQHHVEKQVDQIEDRK